jgi:hypothetical protein
MLIRTTVVAAILWTSAARAEGPPPAQEPPARSKPAPVAWEQDRKNVLGVDALEMFGWPLILRGLVLNLPATFEHAFIPSLSGTGALSLLGAATTSPSSLFSYAFTYRISAGARYYLAGDAPRGCWVGIRGTYSPRDREEVIPGFAGSGARILGEAGYQAIIENGFAIGASIGWDQIAYYIFEQEYASQFPPFLAALRASVIVGWSF